MAGTGKILVFVDLPEGELDETGRGLLSYTSRLAGFLDIPWCAATAAAPETETLAQLARYGTPGITIMEDAATLFDTPVLLGRTVAGVVAQQSATLLVLPHNDLGSTLAPVVAAALDAALFTELTAARRDGDGITLARQALGNRIAETKSWDGTRPLVVTIPVRSLSQVLLPTVTPSSPVIATWRPAARAEGASATILTRIPPNPQTVDLTDAEVIFSAGKGCDQGTFDQLKELCRLLNVSFGVTRPVFDLGWTGFERMVGQTGRTVTPRLYLALGISGSMHHIGGIKDSRRIVAINNDAKAPVFATSDEGFVADLKEVLPRLVARARAVSGGAL